MYKFICKNCEREFEHRNKNRIYCNRECAGIGLKNNTNIEQHCRNCNSIFYVKKTKLNSGRGLYCCKGCYTEYQNDNSAKKMKNDKCVGCGTGIRITPYQRKLGKKYCSRRCSAKAKEKRVVRTCSECNIKYITIPHTLKKFCSIECARKSKKITVECAYCKSIFLLTPSKQKRDKHHLCSNECKFNWQIGRLQPKISEALAAGHASGKIKPYTWKYKTGYIINKSTRKREFYASSYELTRMRQLNDRGVAWTKYHMIKIKYIDKDGQLRYYIPDILVNNTLEEIKPKRLIPTGDNPEKFKAARKYCEQHNLKFKVITEKELKIK